MWNYAVIILMSQIQSLKQEINLNLTSTKSVHFLEKGSNFSEDEENNSSEFIKK